MLSSSRHAIDVMFELPPGVSREISIVARSRTLISPATTPRSLDQLSAKATRVPDGAAAGPCICQGVL